MSRIARAVEILEAINRYFQEGADCVYRDGLILDDENTLGDAIAACIGEAENQIAPIPHSQRRKIGRNYYGHWNGFIGNNKIANFFHDEEAAHKWLNE